jgi:hypothetical protein
MKQHPRIFVCFHSYGSCPTQFAVDLSKALRYSGTIIPAVLHEPSCYVDSARNKLVRKFLAEPSATHMMMVDVDISFDSDAFLKTFTVMTALQADVVYGNYCLGNGANSIFGPPDNKHKEAAVRAALKPNMIYQDIATGGTGWLLATRQVLERMQKECPGPWHWFDRDLTADGSDKRGEDITFGLRVYNMNPRPKVVGITNVVLRHLKNQSTIPDFMTNAAAEEGGAGVVMPNPYEHDPEKYVLLGNAVIDKSTLTPDQLEKVMKEVERYNASLKRETETLHGSGTSPEAQGKENQDGDERAAAGGLRQEAEGPKLPEEGVLDASTSTVPEESPTPTA